MRYLSAAPSQGLFCVCFLLRFLFCLNFDFLLDFGLGAADFAEDVEENNDTNIDKGDDEYGFGLNGESCIVFWEVFETGTLLWWHGINLFFLLFQKNFSLYYELKHVPLAIF